MLIEAVATLALVSTLVWVAAQGAGELATQRRSLHLRELALAEAANHLEILTSLPLSELTPEKLASHKLSAEGAKLPGGKLELALRDPPDATGLRQLNAVIRWQATSGEELHVALSAWTKGGSTP